MGFLRSTMDFFRGGARKHRDERPAELQKEQAEAVTAQPAAVTTQLAAAGREVKREARPNPNKPGWGLSIGQEAGQAREDGASRE